MNRTALNRVLTAGDPVAEAALYAGCLVEAEKKTTGRTLDAVQSVARRCRITPSLVRGLIHPSRRPKVIDARWLGRLWAAYLKHLRRQLAELELEIARVEALAPSDRAARDLLDAAQALVRRLEALIG